jgi:hypothetical protein
MKTVQCPNCGSPATNLKNCEFCGSLFVRAQSCGFDALSLFENNGLESTFIGLKDALDENIANQLKYNKQSGQLCTLIFKSKEDYQLDSEREISEENGNLLGIWNRDYETNALRGEISLVVEVEILTEKQKLLLSQMPEFRLFDDLDSDGLWQIHFGKDTKGAAFIISKILVQLYNLDLNHKLFFKQIVYSTERWPENLLEKTKMTNSSQVEKKSDSCFIATATMGDFNDPVVIDLRNFRDEWILKKSWGENFVKWYYNYGAIVAKKIEKRAFLKKTSYVFIVKPLHFISKYLIK